MKERLQLIGAFYRANASNSVVVDVRHPLVVLVGLDCKSRPTAYDRYDRYDRYDIGDRLDRLFATFFLRGGRGIEK